jgi:hypothetical protein
VPPLFTPPRSAPPSQLVDPGRTISRGLIQGNRRGEAPGANDKTLNEITQWVARDRDRWDLRNQRFQRDQEMYQLLKPGEAESWARNAADVVILSDPKLVIKKVSRIIARHPNNIEITPKQPWLTEVAQRIENYLYGWDQSVALRWIRGLNNPYRYDQAFFLTLRGWLCERTILQPTGLLEESDDPSALFNHQVMDPANVFPGPPSGGDIHRVCHVYSSTVGELRDDPLFYDATAEWLADADDYQRVDIQAVYGHTSDGGWWHAILANSDWLKPPVEIGYNPWTIVLANGASYRATPWDDQAYMDQIGTGLLDDSYANQLHLNRMATKLSALLSLEANPPVSWLSKDGKVHPIKFEPGSRMYGFQGDSIQVHRIGPQLGDYKLLWDILSERADKAGFPAQFWGQDAGEGALNSAIMMAAGKDVLFPFVEAINAADAIKYGRVLQIYRDFGPAQPLQTRMLSPMGQALTAEISASDIAQQGLYVEVTRGDMTPQEFIQKMTLGMQLVKSQALPMSDFRGKDWLALKNPQRANLQVLSEQVYMNPKVIESLVPIALSDTGQQMLGSLWQMIQSGMPAPGSPATPNGEPSNMQQLPSQVQPPASAGNPFTNINAPQEGQDLNQLLGLLNGGAAGGVGGGGVPPNQGQLGPVTPQITPGLGALFGR